MKAFEVWWARLPEPIGRRPVLLLTRTAAYRYLDWVLVAEITSTVRQIPQEVALGRSEGLTRASVANLDNVHRIRTEWLDKRAGALAPSRHPEIKRALGFALDWSELKLL